MGNKYLGAMTSADPSMPHFVNVSQREDGGIVFTARELASDGGRTVTITFPSVLFGVMLADLNKNFGGALPGEPAKTAPERFRPAYVKPKSKK